MTYHSCHLSIFSLDHKRLASFDPIRFDYDGHSAIHVVLDRKTPFEDYLSLFRSSIVQLSTCSSTVRAGEETPALETFFVQARVVWCRAVKFSSENGGQIILELTTQEGPIFGPSSAPCTHLLELLESV